MARSPPCRASPTFATSAPGKLVTDAGLPLLHNFPLLKRKPRGGARLLIDGPFTNQGLASLAGLDGVADLDLFWHVTGITTDAFAHLAHCRIWFPWAATAT